MAKFILFVNNCIYQVFIKNQIIQMQSLQKVAAFKTTAGDFSQINPLLSFYLYKYYMAAAITVYKETTDKSDKTELQTEIKSVEKQMAAMKQAAGGNVNQQTDIPQITEYTESMFAKNDHDYRDGQINQQIAENFLVLFRLYEVCGRFGQLDDNQNKRRLYCKKKFIEIMKQVKSPMNSSKNQPKKENFIQAPPPPPQAKMSQQQLKKSILQSGFKLQLPKPTNVISFDKIQMQMQASKCLQNAVSQLSFDRYKQAREQALKALQILDQLVGQ